MASILEIIDTAVKIGLGAVISGIATHIVSTRKHSHDVKMSKIDTKMNLIKEATISYEEGFNYINKFTSDFRKYGGESISESNAQLISSHLTQAKNLINTAESLARLSGFVELADCYAEYSPYLDEMNSIFSFCPPYNFDLTKECIKEVRVINGKVNPLISKSLDAIYA